MVREHTEARLRRERIELYKRLSRTLRPFGRNWRDYFLLKTRSSAYCQLVLTNNSLILHPRAIKSLQSVLIDFPDWEIVISVVNRESESEDVRKWGYEWPTSEVIIRDDEIVDALDRENLPMEFRDLVIEGSRPPHKLWEGECVAERPLERINKEPSELHARMKLVLQQYGKDDIHGRCDYFLLDEKFELFRQEVEVHRLHMLRPAVIHSLQKLLLDYPDWEIDISIYTPDGKINVGPGTLVIRADEILDTLDRQILPTAYRDFVYRGARLPTRPGERK